MPYQCPVTGPNGEHYRSRSAAARALGVHHSTIDWHLKKYGNLSMVNTWAVPCEHKGRSYPSIAAAAADIGVARHTLHGHLEKHGHLESAGLGRSRGNPGNRGPRKRTKIGPMEWECRLDAARDLRISIATLTRSLSPRASLARREALMIRVMALHDKRTKQNSIKRRGKGKQWEEAF